MSNKQSGFTLVEIIIGIVVLSISLAIVSTLIAPTEEQSADNLLQIKAAELGQSYLNDITSRAFDHNSDMAGGRIRCGEPNAIVNPCSVALGAEPGETNRNLFNDVDDFHNYTSNSDAIDDGLDAGYRNFKVAVTVVYAGCDLGLGNCPNAEGNLLAKKITVTVTTPLGTPIDFATYKTNF
ncbi:type IV pilus modification PilV family protein [Litorilituus sediminis]|uniref:type IV pilus modification PilV family protein n=1 Tax=Litorilituus sediminis TaxID=718192 RepID=UPI001FE5C392|nr:type II secretion system protein [Litorilituus sediminis]